MPSIVLKDIPTKLHARLKQQAAQNHRSMNREATMLLEAALVDPLPPLPRRLPRPYRLRDPRTGKPILMTHAMLMGAIREGRS